MNHIAALGIYFKVVHVDLMVVALWYYDIVALWYYRIIESLIQCYLFYFYIIDFFNYQLFIFLSSLIFYPLFLIIFSFIPFLLFFSKFFFIIPILYQFMSLLLIILIFLSFIFYFLSIISFSIKLQNHFYLSIKKCRIFVFYELILFLFQHYLIYTIHQVLLIKNCRIMIAQF